MRYFSMINIIYYYFSVYKQCLSILVAMSIVSEKDAM